MRLVFILKKIGQQLITAGGLLQVAGILFLLYESLSIGEIVWSRILLTLGASALIVVGVLFYQRQVFWKKLHDQLLRAVVVREAPEAEYRPLPWWLWVFIFVVGFSCSGVVGGVFGILIGALLIGYGLSGSYLSNQVQLLEQNRSAYYAIRDSERKSVLVQHIS